MKTFDEIYTSTITPEFKESLQYCYLEGDGLKLVDSTTYVVAHSDDTLGEEGKVIHILTCEFVGEVLTPVKVVFFFNDSHGILEEVKDNFIEVTSHIPLFLHPIMVKEFVPIPHQMLEELVSEGYMKQASEV